jgi:hypothetical protein
MAVYGFPTISWFLESVTLLAVLPAFHRQAPRVSGRPWWLLIWAALSAQTLFAGVYSVEILIAAAAVGVATAVLQAKVSPAWSIALIIAGWPLILGTIEDYVELPVGYDVAGNAMLIVIASVDVFLLCTVLMSALARRRRAEVAAD